MNSFLKAFLVLMKRSDLLTYRYFHRKKFVVIDRSQAYLVTGSQASSLVT